MITFLRLICIWGIADGFWLALAPEKWSKTWSKVVDAIGKDRLLAGIGGGIEMAICVWILKKLCGRK